MPRIDLNVFVSSSHVSDQQSNWLNMQLTVSMAQKYGFRGVLCYAGNDTYVDPWVFAQYIAQNSTLEPLVAVNPLYVPPYQAAKTIASIASVYRRKCHINLITGTASRDREALNDKLSGFERYDRLTEFAELCRRLLVDRHVTFNGRYYQTLAASLLPKVHREYVPNFYLSGASDAADAAAKTIGATRFQMISAQTDQRSAEGIEAVFFGLVSRLQKADAWAAAREYFPGSELKRELHAVSLSHTDSVWKHRLMETAQSGIQPEWYWMDPFKHGQAACPYVVSSREEAAQMIKGMLLRGVNTILIDLPAEEESFAEASAAIALALR